MAELSREDIIKIVRKAVEEVQVVDSADAYDFGRPLGEQGVDSLDTVEVIMAIEEKTGKAIGDPKFSIPEEALESIRTINEVIDLTVELTRGKELVMPIEEAIATPKK